MTPRPRLLWLTRIGFATRGLLYIVIAWLIFRTARASDPSGALEHLGDSSGRWLLGIMAAGLAGYGLWRLADVAFDIEGHGGDRRGMAERAGAGVSGVVHLFLAWQAVQLIQGVSSGGNGAKEGADAALHLPGGGMILVAGAALLFAIGLYQLAKAAKGSFLDHLEPRIASQPWAGWTGRAGYAARGLIFIISSYFLLRAGIDHRASEAGGIGQALAWLSSPFDMIAAAGLFGFGLFSLIEARYRVLHDRPMGGFLGRGAPWR